ncbi:hypothetical protein, partial [Acinetobacter junii]|uniref:hypothetical protein n=1 Tax=Acinetobacter junii TaxID=40215 RepID=UPI0012FFE3B6
TKKVAVIEGSKIAGGIIGGTVGNFGGKVVARGVIYIIGVVAGWRVSKSFMSRDSMESVFRPVT